MYTEALDDFDAAIKINPNGLKYFHAKGITYEALAAGVERKHGRRRRFDLEEEGTRTDESLTVLLRQDFLDYSQKAIEMYERVLAIDENFNQSRFHLGKMLS